MPEAYSYHIQEKSFTQGFLTKYLWTPIVNKLPSSLKPNTITVIGAIFVFISIFFVWLGLQGYRIGFAIAGFCIFIYMTCDNVDGPHARKTKQSSPLGEFLDHWFDAMDSIIMNLCIMAMFGFSGWLPVICMSLVALSFFATIWEHCYTGVFHSGRMGTNEALLLIITVYFCMTFLFGTSIARFQGYHVINIASVLLYATSIGCIVTLAGIFSRCRKNLSDFLYILLVIIASILWFTYQLFSDQVAVFFVLISNLFFCGRFLLIRLAGLQLPIRIKIIVTMSIIAIILPFLKNWVPEICYQIFLGIVLVLLGIGLIIDIILAIRHLK